ncbi:MAG: methyltransferase domain-containing protein [Saprospiraceae bacterium]|nr:methyltransferase domain-containing protein [Saprospiraceae bacterium]
MKFTEEVLDYLRGNKFSNNFEFQAANDGDLVDRLEFLESLAKNRKVLHFGFTDHVPLIKSKYSKNEWLHKRLVDVSEKCVGIDIDDDAVQFVKEELSIQNVYALDILEDDIPKEILDEEWDYLILGEVLEHINDPVRFLEGIKRRLEANFKIIVITVPNAWDLNNLIRLPSNKELINSDHRFWFSPYTLAKVVTESGYSVRNVRHAQTYMPETWWQRWIVRRYPMTRETIILEASAD